MSQRVFLVASGRNQKVCAGKQIDLRSNCAFFAPCGRVAPLRLPGGRRGSLPHGQAEPKKASDLDIDKDNENVTDIAINSDNESDEEDEIDDTDDDDDKDDDTDDDKNDDHENDENIEKSEC